MTKEGLIVRIVEVLLALIALTGVIMFALGGWWWIPAIVCLSASAGFFFSGLKSIPEEKRWIIEVFGSYWDAKGPGLQWIMPGIMKVREAVSVWEQRYPLFEREIKIDFLNGSATPRDAYVYVQCNIGGPDFDPDAPRKMVYEIKNLKEAVDTLVESALRTFWNGLGVDTGIKFGRGASNLLEEIKEIPNLRKLTEEEIKQIEAEEREVSQPEIRTTLETRSGEKWIEDLQKVVRDWGLKITKITVGDWDLDEVIIQARESVFKGQMAAKEAEFRAIQYGLEAGRTHTEIAKRLSDPESPVRLSKEKSHKMAYNYVTFFRGTEKNQAQVIEWRGGEPILPAIAQGVVAIDAAKKATKKGG